MMNFIFQNKILAAGVLALLFGFGYYLFFMQDSSAPLTTVETESPVTQELLTTLANLRKIELNKSIFTDPVFVSLNDFGVVIPKEPIGRRNPFLPFTGVSQPNTSLKVVPH
jgi:hypothetical protein